MASVARVSALTAVIACSVALSAAVPRAAAWEVRWATATAAAAGARSDQLQAMMIRDTTVPLDGWKAFRVTVRSQQTIVPGPARNTRASTTRADKVAGYLRLSCPLSRRRSRPPYARTSTIYLYGDAVRRLPSPPGFSPGRGRCTVHVVAWAIGYGPDYGRTAPTKVRLSVWVRSIP